MVTAPFDNYPKRYDSWFERNKDAYEAELRALSLVMRKRGRSLEIGVGSGRFAAPLGINVGIEPSLPMAKISAKRGINVVMGIAEHLPLKDESFDTVLMTTTICFVDSPSSSLREAYRVLRGGGALIIGFIDRNSPLGRAYANNSKSVFYRDAVFYSLKEVYNLLAATGFRNLTTRRARIHLGDNDKNNKGSFIVVKGIKATP